MTKAIESNKNNEKTWFFNYSGHVELFEVRLYPEGWWSYEEEAEMGREPMRIVKSCYLHDAEKVEELYWWCKFQIEE